MASARALLCALLLVALCLPQFFTGLPEIQPEQPLQILPTAAASPTILVKPDGPRLETVRHRPADDPLIFILPLETADEQAGRLLPITDDARTPSHRAARTFSGRSPPVAIS